MDPFTEVREPAGAAGRDPSRLPPSRPTCQPLGPPGGRRVRRARGRGSGGDARGRPGACGSCAVFRASISGGEVWGLSEKAAVRNRPSAGRLERPPWSGALSPREGGWARTGRVLRGRKAGVTRGVESGARVTHRCVCDRRAEMEGNVIRGIRVAGRGAEH